MWDECHSSFSCYAAFWQLSAWTFCCQSWNHEIRFVWALCISFLCDPQQWCQIATVAGTMWIGWHQTNGTSSRCQWKGISTRWSAGEGTRCFEWRCACTMETFGFEAWSTSWEVWGWTAEAKWSSCEFHPKSNYGWIGTVVAKGTRRHLCIHLREINVSSHWLPYSASQRTSDCKWSAGCKDSSQDSLLRLCCEDHRRLQAGGGRKYYFASKLPMWAIHSRWLPNAPSIASGVLPLHEGSTGLFTLTPITPEMWTSWWAYDFSSFFQENLRFIEIGKIDFQQWPRWDVKCRFVSWNVHMVPIEKVHTK